MITLKSDETLSIDRIMSLIGKINGIIYARVSTADQANKGYSIESQIDRCVERAKKKFGYKESELITLIEPGGMGDDPNRPALNNVLYLLEKGLGKKLFILHPDRLTRDNTLQGVISRKIWGMGVDIEFIEFEVNPNDPESMLMYNIQGSIAQYTKAKIHANSKRGRIAKAKKGQFPGFKRLYGYKFNTETDLPEYNDEEKEVLLEIVDLFLNKDMSTNEIAKYLSKKGVPAPNGKTWYQSTISRMIQNEDYTGDFYYGKSKVVQLNGKKKQIPTPKEEWILIKIPPLWDHVTREKIIEKLKENFKGRSRKSRDYLLKNKARCGRCGGSCGSGITSKTKAGVYKYYSCRNKNMKGYINGEAVHKCVGKNWRVDIVDEVFWKWFKKQLAEPEEFIKNFVSESLEESNLNDHIKKINKYKKQLEDVDKEISNYVILFGKGKINEDMFDNLTNPLEEQKNFINNELEILEALVQSKNDQIDEQKKFAEYLKSFSEMLTEDCSMEEKRKFLDFFIERVTLYDDDHLEIIWRGKGVESVNIFDKAENNSGNRHKKEIHRQTYGGQTARIHSHSCWLLQGNGSFSIIKPGAAIQISNQYQLS
ncbi:resolvase [Bacillus pumilus]|nr:resolvase [Bacillus pumilus]